MRGQGGLDLCGYSGFVSLSERSHTQRMLLCDGHSLLGSWTKAMVLPLNLGLGVEGAV